MLTLILLLLILTSISYCEVNSSQPPHTVLHTARFQTRAVYVVRLKVRLPLTFPFQLHSCVRQSAIKSDSEAALDNLLCNITNEGDCKF